MICAASGSEARLEHASAEFDLLIVDGSLPDTDELTLIEEFRKTRPKEAILFVSASWRDSESYHRLSKVLSVSSILHKPILPMVLLQELDKALGRGLPIATSKTGKPAEKLARMSAELASELPAQLLEIQNLAEKSRLQNNAVCIAQTCFSNELQDMHLNLSIAICRGCFLRLGACLGDLRKLASLFLKANALY